VSRFDSDFTRRLLDKARGTFGSMDAVRCFVAPGRVNLIGEHTDYNDGFVLPAALDLALVALLAPREDNKAIVVSIDKGPDDEFALDNIPRLPNHEWTNYVRGVVLALQAKGGQIGGFTMVVGSTIPVGSGLSSSAALEVATGFGLGKLFGPELSGPELATMCQRVENEFVGVNCGIMDQFIVSLGQRGHALLIDCRSLEYTPVPLPGGCDVVICDTKKRRGLVDSEYNTRRQECERGASILGVRALRDVTLQQLQEHRDDMDPVTFRRCRHVVSENERTLAAVSALRSGDLTRFGELMNASHRSLRDDYEVSCAELDAMVSAAWEQPGTLGSRMTGAGFGGCTVSLVRSADTVSFVQSVSASYTQATGIVPEIYVCQAEDGVRVID